MASTHVDLSIHLDDDSFRRLDGVIGDLERLASFLSESARSRRLPSPDETQAVRAPTSDATAILRGIGMPEIEPHLINGYAGYVNDNDEEVWLPIGEMPTPTLRQLFVEKKIRT